MALVESFVRFARRIGATVCAEGIESLDDLAVLGDLDVQWGQGYVLGRPAAPWARVSPVAAGGLPGGARGGAARQPAGSGRIAAGDRRLEHLSARLASARSGTDLEGALALIAAELNADKVCLSRWHPEDGMVETLAESGGTGEERFAVSTTIRSPPASCATRRRSRSWSATRKRTRREVELLLSLGLRSLLIVPVISRGESLGIVEAYSKLERPWTRTEINRARIISNQFGSVIRPCSAPAGRPWLLAGPSRLRTLGPGHVRPDLDPHLLRQLAAQDVLAAVDLDEQRSPEGLGAA